MLFLISTLVAFAKERTETYLYSFTLSDTALLEYFRSIFDDDDVLEATVALDLYGLEKKVENRNRALQKLEV